MDVFRGGWRRAHVAFDPDWSLATELLPRIIFAVASAHRNERFPTKGAVGGDLRMGQSLVAMHKLHRNTARMLKKEHVGQPN
jgi:hypothetical protein